MHGRETTLRENGSGCSSPMIAAFTSPSTDGESAVKNIGVFRSRSRSWAISSRNWFHDPLSVFVQMGINDEERGRKLAMIEFRSSWFKDFSLF